jgi:hypothetical protein
MTKGDIDTRILHECAIVMNPLGVAVGVAALLGPASGDSLQVEQGGE